MGGLVCVGPMDSKNRGESVSRPIDPPGGWRALHHRSPSCNCFPSAIGTFPALKRDLGDELRLIFVEDFNMMGLRARVRQLKHVPPRHQHGVRNFRRFSKGNAHSVGELFRLRIRSIRWRAVAQPKIGQTLFQQIHVLSPFQRLRRTKRTPGTPGEFRASSALTQSIGKMTAKHEPLFPKGELTAAIYGELLKTTTLAANHHRSGAGPFWRLPSMTLTA